MKNFSSQKSYKKANDRWPDVKWDYDRYHSHLEGKEVKHPVDMYLAGAAGYRIDSAWCVLEVEYGPKVEQKMAYKPTADYTPEDLWGITRLHVMEDAADSSKLESGHYPARIIQYQGRSTLLYYLTAIACQKANERFRKMSKHKEFSIDGMSGEDEGSFDPAEENGQNPSELLADEEIILGFQKVFKQAVDKLDPDHKYMLQMVLFQGMKQKEAGILIGLSECNAARAMKKIKTALSAEMQSYENLWDNKLFRDAWKEICTRCVE